MMSRGMLERMRGAGRAMVAIAGNGGGAAARAVRAACGAPAGVSRTRRGTFLILVVGTLALLAVISLVYFAIGRADRRSGASVVRGDRLEEVPRRISKHVTSIIGEDIFDRIQEPASFGAAPTRTLYTREAFDNPSTPWHVESTDTQATIGTTPNPRYWTNSGIMSDPWLASTEPTSLRRNGPALAQQPNQDYLRNRDWAHITNIAPDGRFINLANLRNNFAAEPGFGAFGGRPRMSDNLWLYDVADNGNNTGQATGSVRRTDWGGLLRANDPRPAIYTERQRGAFLPARADFDAINPQWVPSNPRYPLNQWADADGDGFLDSRWFEMIDARDQNAVKDLMKVDNRMRWVFAARIIDLSSAVNVNTASDSLDAARQGLPLGITPADIDLQRLLSLQDSWDANGGGYNLLLNTTTNAGDRRPDVYLRYDRQASWNVARDGYASLRRAFEILRVPGATEVPTGEWEWQYNPANPEQALGVAQAERGVARRLFWEQWAASGAAPVYDAGRNEFVASGRFGVEDTVELLTRFGVNDPQITSRLEQTLDGRFATQRRFGPMRSNRGPNVELDRTTTNAQNPPPGSNAGTPESMAWLASDVRHRVTTISGARPIRSRTGPTVPTSNITASDEKLLPLLPIDSASTELAPSVSRLWQGYVGAMAPAIWLENVWPANAGGARTETQTLFYGHRGPEFALLSAAHMTVNMASMLSVNGAPVSGVVPFTDDLGRRLQESQPQPNNAEGLPAFSAVVGGAIPLLDAAWFNDDQVLASSGGGLQAAGATVFGVEPQGFITEAGLFTVYTDAPRSAGGDRDIRPSRPGEPAECCITISGGTAADNSDLLFRCFAVQIHNPFDRPVTLSAPQAGADPSAALNTDGLFQYLRITDSTQRTVRATIKLASITFDNSGNKTQSPITIPAGETVIVYTFSRPIEQVAARLAVLKPSWTPEIALANLQAWARGQFANSPVASGRVFYVQRTDSDVNNALTDFTDFVGDGETGTVVQLFRSTRADMSTIGGTNETQNTNGVFTANLTGNDQMMDRMRLASSQSFDRRLPAGQNTIADTSAGEESSADAPDPVSSNTGFTLTLFSTFHRPVEPGRGEPEPGSIPAYCIEPVSNGGTPWLGAQNDGLTNLAALTKNDFEPNDSPGGQTISEWFTRQRVTPQSTTISTPPDDKSSDGVEMRSNLAGQSFDLIRQELGVAGQTDTGFGSTWSFRTNLPNRSGVHATLRVTDLLRPMLIGAMETPLRGDGQPQTDPDKRYLTRAEAWAISMNYDSLPAIGSDSGVRSLYSDIEANRPVHTFGHVSTEDFTLFRDGNRNGTFDANNAYDPRRDRVSLGNRDALLGLGIPAGLAILDQFRTLPDQYGSFRRAVEGTINLNTATLPVLRTLPGLTPADDASWNTAMSHSLTDLPLATDVDVAAGILSYRDKVPVGVLRGRGGEREVRFEDSAGADLSLPQTLDGRSAKNQINGLRESRGLASVGEVLAAFERSPGRPANDPLRAKKTNIDALGFDTQNNSKPGFDQLVYRDPSNGQGVTDDLSDERDERYILAAGLMNTASTRSDYYACWFIVRGYTRDDVSELGPNDPMVPSIERRFLMIIDRSNVTERGQEPRVVAIKELPL